MSQFNEGDRVVCINDDKPKDFKPDHYPNWVTKGKTYHVRRILNNDDIVPGILLREVVNPPLYIPLINAIQEGAFAEWRFDIEKTAYMIKETEASKPMSFDEVRRKIRENKL